MSFRKNPRPGTIVIRTLGEKYFWRAVIENDGTYIHYATNSNRAIYVGCYCSLSTWEQWCIKYEAVTIDTFINKYKKLHQDLSEANIKLERLKKVN